MMAAYKIQVIEKFQISNIFLNHSCYSNISVNQYGANL